MRTNPSPRLVKQTTNEIRRLLHNQPTVTQTVYGWKIVTQDQGTYCYHAHTVDGKLLPELRKAAQ